MLCLPNTNTSECPSKWHLHGWTTPPHLAALMGTDCPTQQVSAILAILSSEDVEALFNANLPSYWHITDLVQSLVYYTPRYWQPMMAATCLGVLGTDYRGAISYDDVTCDTCQTIVHKALDADHWELVCAQCQHHADDCECCKVCGEHPCECCGICGEGPAYYCNCCLHCENPEGYCTCEICESCGYPEDGCSCDSLSGHTFGKTKTAPWLDREGPPEPLSLPRIGDCANGSIDPLRAAADFYLLDAVKNLVRASDLAGGTVDRFHMSRNDVVQSDSMLSALTQSAEREYRALVDYLAPNFLAYALPAIGGELRYHRAATKAHLGQSRDMAWDNFVSIVEQKGAETLFEADRLFVEFGEGAYGGKKWGNAAKVVGQYLNGTMPAWLFVDRVFTLQHNGGCFLNKVNWARHNGLSWGLSRMETLLNAHAGRDGGTDWALLLKAASPGVANMFRMTERHISRIGRRFGAQLSPIGATAWGRSRNRYDDTYDYSPFDED